MKYLLRYLPLLLLVLLLVSCNPSHEHSLTPVAGKEPTCTEEGNHPHYTCSCGKLFADREGKREITPKQVAIPVVEHANRGPDPYCDTCSKICAVFTDKTSMTLAIRGLAPDTVTALLADGVSRGATALTVTDLPTETELASLISALRALPEGTTLALTLEEVTTIGKEFNHIPALSGYLRLKNGTYAVFSEAGLFAWYNNTSPIAYDLLLTDDITLSPPQEENGSNWPWLAIRCNIDGGGHTITGLTMNSLSSPIHIIGFIGTASDCTIRNLNLAEVSICADGAAAALVGGPVGDVVIQNCRVLSGTVSATSHAAGIAASTATASIFDCHNNATILANDMAGGIIAQATDGRIVGCVNTGAIQGGGSKAYGLAVGGIAGVFHGEILACYSAAPSLLCLGDSPRIGGIVGTGNCTLVANHWNTPSETPLYGKGFGKSNEGATRLTEDASLAAAFEAMNEALAAAGFDFRYPIGD